ncbi:MAG TPA: hypothetical protein VFW21_15305 [Mycobacterium sp.]|nr:hypothetical protein [Mycobacterium sp.]
MVRATARSGEWTATAIAESTRSRILTLRNTAVHGERYAPHLDIPYHTEQQTLTGPSAFSKLTAQHG